MDREKIDGGDQSKSAGRIQKEQEIDFGLEYSKGGGGGLFDRLGAMMKVKELN